MLSIFKKYLTAETAENPEAIFFLELSASSAVNW
jgi:hypothetical protein